MVLRALINSYFVAVFLLIFMHDDFPIWSALLHITSHGVHYCFMLHHLTIYADLFNYKCKAI